MEDCEKDVIVLRTFEKQGPWRDPEVGDPVFKTLPGSSFGEETWRRHRRHPPAIYSGGVIRGSSGSRSGGVGVQSL